MAKFSIVRETCYGSTVMAKKIIIYGKISYFYDINIIKQNSCDRNKKKYLLTKLVTT